MCRLGAKAVVVSHLQRFSEVAHILGEEVLPTCASDLLFLLLQSCLFSGCRGRTARSRTGCPWVCSPGTMAPVVLSQ